MTKLISFFLVLALVATLSCTNFRKNHKIQATSQGTLFIIGGGNRDSALMETLITVSGWKEGDWISVVTLASRWDSTYVSLNDEFKRYTRTNINCIRIDSVSVHFKAMLDSLKQSKLIYLSGGDQNLLMKHIQGTEFKKIINQAYEQGATIAGTSAGAALMSEKMVSGNQLNGRVYVSVIPSIWKNNVEINEGLGFLDSVIVDQHFIVRSRHNRLIAAVLENKLDGIGIDESTAIIVRGDSATVIGESQVIVYQSPERVSQSGVNLLGSKKMIMSIYLPGEKFKIKR